MRWFWQVVIGSCALVAWPPGSAAAEEQWIAESVQLTGYEEEYRGPEPPSNYPGLRNLSPGAPVCASFHESGREALVVAEGWQTYESIWEEDEFQEVPDHWAYLWSTVTGEIVERFDHHRAPIVGCALAPDGRRAVTADRDGTILWWDLKSRRVVHRWQGYVPKIESSGRFVHFAFSADGAVLGAAAWGGPLRVWDTPSGRLLQEIDGEPTELAISPDGSRIAWRESKAGTFVADVATGKVVQQLKDPKSSWYSAAATFSRDGSRIYVASGRRVTEWDLTSGTPRRQLIHPSDRSGSIQGLEVSPDGSLLLSWGGVPEMAVFDLESGEVVGQPTVRGPDVVSASFTSKGRQIRALAGNTWQASVWDVPQAPSSLRLGVTVLAELEARGVEEESLAFSPDDATLAAVLPSRTSGQMTLRLWSTETWEPSRDFVLHTYSQPRKLVFSPDGREIVVSGGGHGTYLVDAETGEYLELERDSEISGVHRVYKTDIEIPSARLYAPQGLFFPIDDRPALFGRDRRECVRLWDLKSMRPLTRYVLEMFTRLTVMPDGEHALVWRPDADHPVLIDVFSGRVEDPLETLEGRVLGVAPEGDRIVVSKNQRHLAVLSFPDLQEIAAWEARHEGEPVHFLGSDILTLHRDGRMRIWSPDSEKPIRTIAIHASGLKRVVLSHDRRTGVSLDVSDRLLAWSVPDLSEALGD